MKSRVAQWFFASLAAVLIAGCTTGSKIENASEAAGAAAVLGVQKAKELPLADVHFHPMLFMSPKELLERMDRYNIRWTGGAGAIGDRSNPGPPRDKQFKEALGNRYLRFTGFWEQIVGIHTDQFNMADEGNKAFKAALRRIEDNLESGSAQGIGEIFVNTRTSSADPRMRIKIAPNSTGMRALWAFSARYGVPLGIHMQFDPDSVDQLRDLLESDPRGTLVLVHAGKDTTAEQVRPLLEKYQNLFCDLCFRSPPQEKVTRFDVRVIYWKSGIKSDWKKLIEDYPDRFFVGIDDVYSWREYDEVHVTIREGLLANLTPDTAEKVAYKNAVRVFKLR